MRIALVVEVVNHAPHAVISIQDSGMGIPPDQLEQIFERNYRYDRPGMGIEGSGLGLAICRKSYKRTEEWFERRATARWGRHSM